MRKVSVNKNQLLEILKKNKAIHENEYNELQEAYLESVISGLSKLLKEAKKKLPEPKTALMLNVPKSYVEDYTNIIGMLEMSIDNDFTIDEEEYKNYVLNEWSWSRNFNMSKTAYGK